MDSAIMAADKKLASLAQDREVMDIYERRLKAEWDHASAISSAERRGIEKVARNALAKGIPIEVVCEITGLDMETVSSLGA